jgi:hypothetical protein
VNKTGKRLPLQQPFPVLLPHPLKANCSAIASQLAALDKADELL